MMPHFRHRLPRRRDATKKRAGFRTRALLLAVTATAFFGVAAASASADASVEAIWSFSGGKVGIQKQPSGKLVGTVVSPTKFTECTHALGEELWTQFTPQPDGSYWGLHQWFFATEACIPNPTLGLTAWRVLEKEKARFLRVCLSDPGNPLQPTIAADGTVANATYGCYDSARVASLPGASPVKLRRTVTMPKNASCLHRNRFRVLVHSGQNDPLSKLVLTLRSGGLKKKGTVKPRPWGAIASVSLKGLPRSAFSVVVKLETILGGHASVKRSYRLCAPKHAHARS